MRVEREQLEKRKERLEDESKKMHQWDPLLVIALWSVELMRFFENNGDTFK